MTLPPPTPGSGPPLPPAHPERRVPELRQLPSRPGDPTHRAIAELAPGDQLQVRPKSDRWELRNYAGVVVGTLARKFEPPPDMRCVKATVLAVATWSRERSDPQYQQHLRNDIWEVVVPELVFEPAISGEPELQQPQRRS